LRKRGKGLKNKGITRGNLKDSANVKSKKKQVEKGGRDLNSQMPRGLPPRDREGPTNPTFASKKRGTVKCAEQRRKKQRQKTDGEDTVGSTPCVGQA